MGVLPTLAFLALAAAEGEVVFITGASSGIGEACARELAKAGKRIVMTARRVDKLKVIAEEINAAGGKAVYTAMDVVDDEATAKAFEFAEKEFGGVDFVFANAGYCPSVVTPLTEQDAAGDISKTLDINVKGQVYTLRHAVKAFKKRGGGGIAFSSSIASLGNYKYQTELAKGFPGAPMLVYALSKYSLDGIVRLAGAYHDENIRAYGLRIAIFESEMTLNFVDDMNTIMPEDQKMANLDPFAGHQPLFPQIGDPKTIAPVLLSLIDGTTKYPSGSSFVVDNDGTADADFWTKLADNPGATVPTRDEMQKHIRSATGGPYDWSKRGGGEL